MSYCVEYPSGSGMIVELNDDNTWRLPGHLSANFKSSPFKDGTGTWSGKFGDFLTMYGSDGKTEILELKDASEREGPATDPRLRPGSTAPIWRRIMKPGEPHLWVGVAGKGGAELGLGAEILFAVVVSSQNLQRWCAFRMLSGRFGFAGGGGGGISLVVITGVTSPKQLEVGVQSGSDWALSIGERWGSVAKSLTQVKELTELGSRVKFCLEQGDKLVTLGKGVCQEACLDYDEVNMLVLDTAAGAGAELGYYWWIGTVSVLGDSTNPPRAAGGRGPVIVPRYRRC
jgi:hypothetical protein